MLTVNDVLENPAFSDFKVLSGHKGLSREVKLVTVMDAPDPFQWSIGGEIVLSSGYVFKVNYDRFEDILLSMKKSGNSALFIKVGRFFEKLPQNVLEYSDEIEFPIVEIPTKKAFVEIINPILSQVIKSQSEAISMSDNINRVFTDLVINDSDTQSIINSVSSILKSDVLFVDTYFSERYISYTSSKEGISGVQCDVNDVYKDRLMNMKTNELLEMYESYPVGNSKKIYGYLVFLNGGVVNDYHGALSHANTALILDIQKKICSMQIEARHRNEFVQDVIMNNIKYREEVYERARLYGWEFSKNMAVMCVDIDELKVRYIPSAESSPHILEDVREKILNMTVSTVRKFFSGAMYVSLSDSVAFILPIDEYYNRYVDDCIKEIKKDTQEKYGFTVTIGTGSEKSDVMEIYKSYNEARLTIDIARLVHNGNIHIRYDDLGIYKLIYSLKDHIEIEKYYNSNMRKLIEYDKEHNAQLYETLGAIIENNWNLKKASEILYIHYNTIKYRYRKILDILEIDENDIDDRLNLTLSWRIGEMIKKI